MALCCHPTAAGLSNRRQEQRVQADSPKGDTSHSNRGVYFQLPLEALDKEGRGVTIRELCEAPGSANLADPDLGAEY